MDNITLTLCLTISIFIFIISYYIINRDKELTYLSLFIFIFVLLFEISYIYKIVTLTVALSFVFIFALVAIPAYFSEKVESFENESVNSKTFVTYHKFEYSSSLPYYRINKFFEKSGELDFKNKNSALYSEKYVYANSYKISNSISFELDDVKFYMIDRYFNYKKRQSRLNSLCKDFICIVETDKQIRLPDFVVYDRIPIVDSLRYLFTLDKNKFVNIGNDNFFTKNYIIESNNPIKVKDFFSLKLIKAFRYHVLQGTILECKNNRLIIRADHPTSSIEKESMLNIAFALFGIEKNRLRYTKTDEYDDLDKLPAIISYFFEKTGDNVYTLKIPSWLIAIIIVIIMMIVFCISFSVMRRIKEWLI